MKKKIKALFLAVTMALSLTACGEHSVVTTENGNSVKLSDDEKGEKNIESTAEQQTTVKKTEDYYLTYVLGKMVVDGKETVFLTDERNMDSWNVPIKDAVPGDGEEVARIKFIGIDWRADGSIAQVDMSDFLSSNTFGSLKTSDTGGKLSVGSYGYNPDNTPSKRSEWDIEVNGTEVVLINEKGTIYYFYEDHFGE